MRLADDAGSFEPLHLRSIRYQGSVDLPLARRGERPVADDALGTALESVTLIRKAYWMATLVAKAEADVTARPDGRELVALRWFDFAEAEERVLDTNHPQKSDLLRGALRACKRDLLGGTSPSEIRGQIPIG
jgi:hypothetical protein